MTRHEFAKNRLVRFLYRWLPIVFGCHCRPERSFFYKGIQFPICARCTGMLLGMILGLATMWAWIPRLWLLILIMLPLIADGTIQKRTRYESTNSRRLLSGVLYGYALTGAVWLYLRSGYRQGMRIGHWLKNRA